MDNRNVAATTMLRVASLIGLALLALLYLQFGIQALFQSPPQGILSLVGSVALGWGAVRTFQRRPAAAIVVVGNVPILLFHAVYTLVDPGELPFLILSLPVPLAAAAMWLVGRRGITAQEGRQARSKSFSSATPDPDEVANGVVARSDDAHRPPVAR